MRYDSVQEDWRAFLTDGKASLFNRHTYELENDYLMLSVSLNETLSFHRQGKSVDACKKSEGPAALCARLAIRTNTVLHSRCQHARHFGILPTLALLHPANFKSER